MLQIETKSLFPELTRQEADIACIIGEECLRAKEIADKKFISEHTANNHIRMIKEILSLKSNMEIVREYWRRREDAIKRTAGSIAFIFLIAFQTFFSNGDDFARRTRVRRARRNEVELIRQ